AGADNLHDDPFALDHSFVQVAHRRAPPPRNQPYTGRHACQSGLSQSAGLSRLSAIFLAAAIAVAKGGVLILVRAILAQQRRDRLVRAAAHSGMERRFEAAAKTRLDGFEIAVLIVLRLGASKADPPALARGIDALGAVVLQRPAHGLGLLIVGCAYDDDRAPLAQSVFVNEPFVLR